MVKVQLFLNQIQSGRIVAAVLLLPVTITIFLLFCAGNISLCWNEMKNGNINFSKHIHNQHKHESFHLCNRTKYGYSDYLELQQTKCRIYIFALSKFSTFRKWAVSHVKYYVSNIWDCTFHFRWTM